MKTNLAALLLLLLTVRYAEAGSATWNLNPTDNDWNTAENWTPETVPNSETDVATFGQSNVTDIGLSQTEVGSVIFTPEASSYTFTLYDDSGTAYLEVWGEGVINNSPNEQTFVFPTSPQSSNILFRNTATAGERVTYYCSNGGSGMLFVDSASAGSATFDVSDGADLSFFSDEATAANATIITSHYGYCDVFYGTAGNASITNEPDGYTEFDASAGSATIVNLGAATADESPGWTDFAHSGNAENSVISNYPATVQGGHGGFTYFNSFGMTEPATVTNYGSAFGGDSAGKTFIGFSAGNATLIAHGGVGRGAGGAILFKDAGDGNTCRVELDGNGFLDVSTLSWGTTEIGSVEGDGNVFLGATVLTIGTNNHDTQFDGLIQDSGRIHQAGGALIKAGNGTLRLTGANTYTGGTTVKRGALRISNSEGSGTGTGAVVVDAGRLGGSGTISGAVVLGMSTRRGAFLQPGLGTSVSTTLRVQNTVTFRGNSTYVWKIDAKKAEADQLVAAGVTIKSGAQFDAGAATNQKLTAGTVFTPINNTSADLISGTFANLADGGTITIGENTFQASYEGGDGNDLTLTVVP